MANLGHPFVAEKLEWEELVDMAVVDELLGERYQAKRANDYRRADDIQEELKGMSVEVDDRELSWRLMGADWT